MTTGPIYLLTEQEAGRFLRLIDSALDGGYCPEVLSRRVM